MKDIIPAKKESPLLGLSGMGGGVGSNLVGGLDAKTYVNDVFAIDKWHGNNATRTIDNGLDMSGEGGAVFIKATDFTSDWIVGGTGIGAGANATQNNMSTNSNGGVIDNETDRFKSLKSNGFEIGADNQVNNGNYDYMSFSFRKQKKFFDIVEYTGTSVAQAIPHGLDSVPGMIIVKAKANNRDWICYHRSLTASSRIRLDSNTDKNVSSGWWNNTEPTSTHFTVGTNGDVNYDGTDFIAYVFAHNESAFGEDSDLPIIACGTYSGNGGHKDVNFGFEPSFWMVKNVDSSENWCIANSTDAFGYAQATGDHPTDAETLAINTSSQISTTNARISQITSGIRILSESQGFLNANANQYIYLAVRSSVGLVSRVAASGIDVFHTTSANNPNGACPPGSFNFGFEADFVLTRPRSSSSDWYASTRKSGTRRWLPNSTSGNNTADSNYVWDSSTGWGQNIGGLESAWIWKRSRGFEVAYNYAGGNGTFTHSLGQVPEMIWVGNLSQNDWHGVGHHKLRTVDPWNYVAYMNNDSAGNSGVGYWNHTAPTATEYTLGNNTAMCSGGIVLCMWCSVEGISKIDDYDGDGGTSNAVNCGFQPRYVMIKRVDSSGDWKIWDHSRGTNVLRLNLTNNQVNDNLVQFTSTGFTLISPDGTVNADGGRYIYHAQA